MPSPLSNTALLTVIAAGLGYSVTGEMAGTYKPPAQETPQDRAARDARIRQRALAEREGAEELMRKAQDKRDRKARARIARDNGGKR